jgi:hypothetical protein
MRFVLFNMFQYVAPRVKIFSKLEEFKASVYVKMFTFALFTIFNAILLTLKQKTNSVALVSE